MDFSVYLLKAGEKEIRESLFIIYQVAPVVINKQTLFQNSLCTSFDKHLISTKFFYMLLLDIKTGVQHYI